ncbi:hypothetical protein BDP55DRAFT_164191 [Colletotrichum godetiae]|uniref:Zn(2)-C6 fungal-type domain-containing protein n=1 Tax=Colletotrichum godetiae TaxID=1209918 RepID=A0AAJ0AM55_9PEZI|nr:uncharacterized protein BDP55DRAFT_164191 [Colletotrichum godetiae]KAK1674927.1 hypothetical protein BDP55DRAFT_164191 [Colletotrichum godetiae]
MMAGDERGTITVRTAASERRAAAAKRRFVRRGTKSCWECRRRKIRCIFDDNGLRDTCKTCWQKGTPCVSQEFPEEDAQTAPAPVGSLGDRLNRVERLVEQLYHRVDDLDVPMPSSPQEKIGGSCSPGGEESAAIGPATEAGSEAVGSPSPTRNADSSTIQSQQENNDAQSIEGSSRPQVTTHYETTATVRPTVNAKLTAYTRQLSAAIPALEDCRVIYKLYSEADIVFQLMFTPHCLLEKLKPESVEHFMESLRTPMHPTLLAKKMLMLGTMLQRVPTHAGEIASEETYRIVDRLAETAISVVCENNVLLGTLDGLECLILQTVYHANGGNPRLSLLTCRRAITVAQLMGLHRPHDPATIETVDSNSTAVPGFVWFRLVYLERFICLLLGLPSSTHDAKVVNDEKTQMYVNSHHIDRLEQVHSAIAAKIIQRNESGSYLFDMDTTHALDQELQVIATTMPSRWWTIPNFTKRHKDPMPIVRNSLNLANQLFHFFLIIELHLPFMLRHSKNGAASSSRMACVDASREVLSRFIAIRNPEGICSIPDAADFFALIAAMTLMLAHIDARRRDRGKDILAHQRHTDRDKVEQTLEHMRDGSSKNTDMLSMKSADVLKSLLAIEADAAGGSTFTASLSSAPTPASASCGGAGDERSTGDARNVLQLKIPCYGTVIISPDAPPSREPWMPVSRAQHGMVPESRIPGNLNVATPFVGGPPAGLCPGEEAAFIPNSSGQGGENLQLDPDVDPRWLFELGNPRLLGNGIAAGLEDWPFQGVDAAFFDSMIRGFEGGDEFSGGSVP